MAKSQLEKTISEAANTFALQILDAVKNSTLQELLALQQGDAPKKRGRPAKTETVVKKRGRKPGRPPKAKKTRGRPAKKSE